MATTYAKHKMLNALAPDEISAHSAFPGSTGASEISGSRTAYSFATAAGEIRTGILVELPVTAGSTVRWLCLWELDNLVWVTPNGGAPKEFMADPTADTIICPSHGYSDGDTVTFYGATPPAPLVQGTVYYVVSSATNTFQVAATAGGAAIDLTDYGAGGCQVSVVYEDTYASDDVHEVPSTTLGLPF